MNDNNYLIPVNDDKYYSFSLAKQLVNNSIDLDIFELDKIFLYRSKYLLDRYLTKNLSNVEFDVFKNVFTLGTHIDFYRSYFLETEEVKNVSSSSGQITLTAYGKSKRQDRKIIAFRGIFEDNLLKSFEDNTESCDSYRQDEMLEEKYEVKAFRLLQEVILNGETNLLSIEKIREIYSNWATEYLKGNISDYKKFFTPDAKSERIYATDASSGILYDKNDQDLKALREYMESLEGKNVQKKALTTKSSRDWSWPIEGVEPITKALDRLHKGANGSSYSSLNDEMDRYIHDLSIDPLYSKNMKKYNEYIHSLLDFEPEEELLQTVNELKQKSIDLAKKENKGNAIIGCLALIIIIVFLLFLGNLFS